MSSNRIRDGLCEERDRLLLRGDWRALDAHVLACPRCREQQSPNGDGDAPAAAGDEDEGPTSPMPGRDPLPNGAGPSAVPVVPGYRILGKLAEGGMGVVYRAEHLASGRVVALKMLKADDGAGPEERERFRAEAEVVAALRHPNVVEIIEVGEHDGRPFFSMELCEGGSLAAQLDGPRPSREAASLVEVLARAVQAAHDRGVIHRDLKPANVLLTAGGTPKVSDFGLAKRLDETGWTSSGRVMGTPHYMAPEQAAGLKHEIGPATDVYSLGVILYELMTGKPPFHEIKEPASVVYHVLKVTPPPPSSVQPNVDRGLEEICLKCLRKDPRKRYRSARALANALRRFQRGGSVRLTVAAAAALATTVAVTALIVFGGGWQTERARDDLSRRVNEAENKVMPALRADLADANGRLNDLAAKQAGLERDRAAAAEGRRNAEARIQAAEDEAGGANKRADGLAAQLAGAVTQFQDLKNKLADSETARTAAEGRAETAEKKAAETQQKLDEAATAVKKLSPVKAPYRIAVAPPDAAVKVNGAAIPVKDGRVEGETTEGASVVVDASAEGHRPRRIAFLPDDLKGNGNEAEVSLPRFLRFEPRPNRVTINGTEVALNNSDEAEFPRSATDTYLIDAEAPAGYVRFQTKLSGADLAKGGFAVSLSKIEAGLVRWLVKDGEAVLTAGWSSDGRSMFAIRQDGSVSKWDASAEGGAPTVHKIDFRCHSAALSANGARAALVADDEILVVDLDPLKEVQRIKTKTTYQDHGNVAALSASGKYVAGFFESQVEVWDADSGKPLKELDVSKFEGVASSSRVQSVCFSPTEDGKLLAIACGGEVIFWDWGSDKTAVKKVCEGVECIAFSPDGKYLAVGSDTYDHRLYVLDVERKSIPHALVGHANSVEAVAWAGDSTWPISGDFNGEVILWDAVKGEKFYSFYDHDQEQVRGLSASPRNPQTALVLSRDGLQLVRLRMAPRRDE